MPYLAGDILLKIDLRATAQTIYTRHHVMLVIGESERGYPLIAHMMAAPNWKLIEEELTRGNKLTLIRYPLKAKTRSAITQAAQDALSSNKFQINREIIQKHLVESFPFRPECSLEAQRKLELLHLAFTLESAKSIDFSPIPSTNQTMSCHEWVLAVIHYGCRQTNEPIPLGLQVPPRLAWADLLCYSAENDSLFSCSSVTITSPLEKAKPAPSQALDTSLATPQIEESGVNLRRIMSLFSFFYPTIFEQKTDAKQLDSAPTSSC